MKDRMIFYVAIAFQTLCYANANSQEMMIRHLIQDSLPTGDRYRIAEDSYQHYNVKMKKYGVAVTMVDNRKHPVNIDNGADIFLSATFQKGKGVVKSLKIQKGYMVSNNRGEMGGDLYIVSPDKRQSSLIAPGITASGLHNYANKIVALNAIFSSVSSGKGEVLEVFYDKKWECKKIIDLPEAPIISLVINDLMIIVASNEIYLLDVNFSIEKVIQLPFSLATLYPSSICGNKNEIFIGMRSGVLRVARLKSSSSLEWYRK